MPRKKQPKKFEFSEPPQLVWREEVKKGIWTIRAGDLKVTVHPHINSPGVLFVSCPTVDMDMVELKGVTGIEEAKVAGLELVNVRILALKSKIDQMIVATGS